MPFAIKIFKILSYPNSFAVITIPLSDKILPLFFPLKRLPSLRISISVTSKVNCSSEKAFKLTNKIKKKS